MRRRWYWWLALWVMLVAAGVFVLQGLSDFDLSGRDQTELSFPSDGYVISGTLLLPKTALRPAVALIVHGDGPQDRFAEGGYLPLINALLDAGIGVFTWDKPGVGASEGHWLDQSMQDRAAEVAAAYQMVQGLPEVASDRVGFLGFSQAGWVVPQVAGEVTPAFTVLVGAAVNWQRQGDYYTAVRLRSAGWEADAIREQIAQDSADDDRFFAADHVPADAELGDMSRQRFEFVRRNRAVDASADIARMQGPVLALWGADDLNVDAAANAATFATLLPDNAVQSADVLADATHALLRRWPFNAQLTSEWPPYVRWAFAGLGRRVYAPGALDRITGWINDQTR